MPLKPTTKRKGKRRKSTTAPEQEISLAGFRKTVWNICSRYVRLRDCLKTTGTKEWGHCVTCGKLYHYKKLQAGHFTSGRVDAVLFEESGIHAQCYRCNIERSGEWPTYYRFMQNEYGQDEIERLVALSLSDVPLTGIQLRDLFIRFKTGVHRLENLTL